MVRVQRRVIVGATTAAVVLGGSGYAIAQTGGGSASYRLATAQVGSVEQTLTLGGTVNSSARHDVSFAQSGKVKAVYVQQGDQVKAGEVLAALDPTSAESTLLAAKATLAKAEASLADTSSSQTAAVVSAASSSSSSSSAASGSSSSKTSSGSKSSSTGATSAATRAAEAELKKAQDQLRQAVQTADGALRASAQASQAVTVGCAGVTGAGSGAPTSTPTATATPSADPTGSSDSSSSSPTQAQLQQCNDLLTALSQAQAKVASAQQSEQMAINSLAQVLSKASSQGASGSSGAAAPSGVRGSGGSTSSTATSGSSGSGSSFGSGSSARTGSTGSTGSTSSSTSSASRLASEQASVDAAQADVISAQVARDDTVLRAPVGGRVIAVSVAAGDTASTTTAAVTILGRGASTVVVSVPLAQIPEVKVGQASRVVVSGSAGEISAVVSNVGIVPSTSTSGTTTYPVTVSLTGNAPALQGIGASVTIVTGAASGVVTVPASAITTVGTRKIVELYSDGKVTATPVTVGVLGAADASITSGLKAGEQVVLADLNASVPTSNTSGTGTRGFGGGGLGGLTGGGGLGGGGFTSIRRGG